jgi:hypothetical protein
MKSKQSKSFIKSIPFRQVKDELLRLEAYRIKSKARNDTFREAMKSALDSDSVNQQAADQRYGGVTTVSAHLARSR